MATTITIQATRSLDQRSVTITSESYLDLITSIDLNIYTTTLTTADATYTFTAGEVSTFVSTGTVTLTFEQIFGTEFIQDNWYITYLTGNSGDYVSNYDGFGVYTYVKTKVFEQVNSLHTPEFITQTMESLFLKKLWLEGLEELDNSTIVSRDVKFKKRLSALTKMLA